MLYVASARVASFSCVHVCASLTYGVLICVLDPTHTGFRSDAGPWTVLGADALVEDEGTYKPDFSAHAGSERLRCVRISKASFDTITSMSRQEGQTPPALRIEADAAEGTVDGSGGGNVMAASGNGGGSARKGAAKVRAFSDEGAGTGTRHSTASTPTTASGGGGTPGTRITLSPPKRRGAPSGASFKLLQAATGMAVIPPSATSPTQATQQQPDKPPPLEPQARPAGAGVDSTTAQEAQEEKAVADATAAATAVGTACSPGSSRVAGSEGDADSGGSGAQQQNHADGADGADAETQKTARI